MGLILRLKYRYLHVNFSIIFHSKILSHLEVTKVSLDCPLAEYEVL